VSTKPGGDPRPAPQPEALATEIAAAMRKLPTQTTPSMRTVRRAYSQRIKAWDSEQVLQLAEILLHRPNLRWIGYELFRFHPAAFRSLNAERLQRLGQGIDSWESVDTFARLLAGPAWLRGQIPDALIHDWAHSPDLWWRRAALVSTVALNAKVDKGPGDVPRTLRVCRLLVDDRQDMVVKAMSWALRELVPHDPAALQAFLQEHDGALAARVRREVRTKLETGLKNPRRATEKVRTRPRSRLNGPDRVKR
jgi:3-methyladenine DNA glycosylase AlkD